MRADERHGLASSTLDPMTPVLADVLGLGPGGAAELGLDAAALAARKWQTAICRALELAQVPYVIVDETASADTAEESPVTSNGTTVSVNPSSCIQ